jgi:iron complex outermembrane receptor protein
MANRGVVSDLFMSTTLAIAGGIIFLCDAAAAQTSPPSPSATVKAPAASPATVAPEQASSPAGAGAVVTNGSSVEQVVVTARRRSESLSKVPVTVTALGGAELAERAITTDADLQRSVPGLTVRETFSSNFQNYALRGQTVDPFSGTRPAVVAYFDDVQASESAASDFYDLSSIQVLEGPQGTLFGRNATGGAVLYSTTMPKNEYSGYATVSAGDYGLQGVEAAVDLPAIPDKLLIRLAGFEKSRDGYVDNLFSGEQLGSYREKSGRATVVAKPTDKLTITTVYQYTSNHSADAGDEVYSVYGCGSSNGRYKLNTTIGCFYSPALDAAIGVPGAWNAFLAAHPGVPAGGMPAEAALQKAWGPWKTSLDEPEGSVVEARQLANTIAYQVTPDITFKNIFGFGSQNTHIHMDNDGSPFPIEHNVNLITGETGPVFNVKNFSEEAQILGSALNHRLTYVGGIYYGTEDDDYRPNLVVFNLTPIIPPSSDSLTYILHNNSEAIFFQGTYDIGDLIGVPNLRFTAGARDTWDNNGITYIYGSGFYGSPEDHESASKPSWQFSLEYQVLPQLLLYADQRGSWRGGGINGGAPPIDKQASQGGNLFLPETTVDFEVGAKFNGTFLSRPARLNLALYDQVVDNVQRGAQVALNGSLASVTANVPRAEITGAELDGDFAPLNWLRIGGTFAWTDARYTDGNVTLLGQSYSYNSYEDTPRLSGDAFMQVFLPLKSDWGSASIRADIYAQTTQYFSNEDFSTQPGTAIKAYHLVNLHADWKHIFNSQVSVSAFVTNLGNQPYFLGGNPQGDSAGFNVAVPGTPRMFGFSVTAAF